MIPPKYLFCLLTCLLVVGLLGTPSAVAQISTLKPPAQLAGFQVVSTPNSVDGPGTVFSLDKEGIRHEYERIDTAHNVGIRDLATLETISFQAEMTVADLQRFITGEDQLDMAVRVRNIEPSAKIRIEIAVEGLRRQGLQENLDQVLAGMSVVKDWKGSTKYFLITETLAAAQISYKLKKADMKMLSDLLADLAVRQPTMSYKPDESFQIVQRFKTPQYIALKLSELHPTLSSLTGVPIGTQRVAVAKQMSWSAALEPLPWPPPQWSARFEVPANVLIKAGATLGSVFDLLKGAYERAGISDRWVYSIGEDGFAIVSRQEAIDGQGNPQPDGLRWTDNPCDLPWSLLSCIAGSAQLDKRTTVFLVTNWTLGSGSKASPAFLRQDSGRSSLPQQMRLKAIPPDTVVQVLIYHFLKRNQVPAELVRPDQERIQSIDHLVRAGFWRAEDLQR